MQDTTRPTVSVLESISPDVLFSVSGGCKKRCAPPAPAPAPAAPAPTPIMQVMQVQAAPQPLPQALPPPPMSSGPEVSTSVSINGQPA